MTIHRLGVQKPTRKANTLPTNILPGDKGFMGNNVSVSVTSSRKIKLKQYSGILSMHCNELKKNNEGITIVFVEQHLALPGLLI